jgi:hypothetical protein
VTEAGHIWLLFARALAFLHSHISALIDCVETTGFSVGFTTFIDLFLILSHIVWWVLRWCGGRFSKSFTPWLF